MGSLDALLFGIRSIFASGVALPERSAVDFIGGTVVDNPATGRTEVTIESAAVMLPADVWLSSGRLATTSATRLTLGGRNVSFSAYPATIGDLTRAISFNAMVGNDDGASAAELTLWRDDPGMAGAALATGSFSDNVTAGIQSVLYVPSFTDAYYSIALRRSSGAGNAILLGAWFEIVYT
jgi:hypothetical protein